MKWVVILAIVVAAPACGRRDAEVARMQKQIDDLTAEVARLKQEAADQQRAASEARLPERPGVGEPTVPACRDYLAAIESYLECDRVSAPARAAVRDSVTKMRGTWSDNMSEDARKAAATACAASTEALQQGAAAAGCPPHGQRGP